MVYVASRRPSSVSLIVENPAFYLRVLECAQLTKMEDSVELYFTKV